MSTKFTKLLLAYNMSDALLLPILNKCRNSLNALRFRGATESQPRVSRLLEGARSWRCFILTIMLLEIVEGLPKLRECDLSSSSSLTDEGVIGLAMSCPGLEIVSLSNCLSITDAAIASLVQCRALKKLHLSNNELLTDAAFVGLVRRMLA